MVPAPDPGRPRRRGRRLWQPLASAVGSVGLTAVMSYLFNRTVRADMLITGLVCGLVMERIVGATTRDYRRKLAAANAALEERVRARTADLAAANASLVAAAAEQAQLRDELLMRDRLATAGMLAAGVSHEIRSPLTVIGVGVLELEDGLAGGRPDELAAVVADVRAAADQIGVVVRDLSSLARPAGEALAPVALAPVVASAMRLASYQFGRGVSVRCRRLTDQPVVGNDARLVQVLLNLLTNAARASTSDRRNAIEVAAESRADTVVVTVTDTGTGMSPEVQARLFQPFFTTGAERGGTGLGLSICRSILDRLGGSIEVHSTPGAGTAVEVTLQRAPRASA